MNNTKLKRVVFICDLGHCSHRIPGLAEELTRNGHKVEVITPQMRKGQKKYFGLSENHSWKLIETQGFKLQYKRFSYLGRFPQRVYAKTIKIANKMGTRFPKTFKHFSKTLQKSHSEWAPYVEKEFSRIISESPVDFIVASGTPFELFNIASQISIKNGIPWIADYRDLWSQNHTNANESTELLIQHEKKIVSTSSGISTVSQECKVMLKQIYKGPIAVVKNASYRPIGNLKTIPNAPFIIRYTGSIYDQYRDFTHIIKALAIVNQSQPNAAFIEFIGPSNHLIKRFINENTSFRKLVKLINERDRAYSFRKQEKADLLLVLNWEDRTRDGALGTKIYEYFRASVPILATGGSGNDELCQMLRMSGCGYISTSIERTADIISEIIRNKNYGLTRNNDYISEFNYSSQCSKLEDLFQRIDSEQNEVD